MNNLAGRKSICKTQIILAQMFPTPTLSKDRDGFYIPLLDYWKKELKRVEAQIQFKEEPKE